MAMPKREKPTHKVTPGSKEKAKGKGAKSKGEQRTGGGKAAVTGKASATPAGSPSAAKDGYVDLLGASLEAKPAAKGAKPTAAKGTKADAKGTKADAKGAKADAKGAKGAKADAKGAKGAKGAAPEFDPFGGDGMMDFFEDFVPEPTSSLKFEDVAKALRAAGRPIIQGTAQIDVNGGKLIDESTIRLLVREGVLRNPDDAFSPYLVDGDEEFDDRLDDSLDDSLSINEEDFMMEIHARMEDAAKRGDEKSLRQLGAVNVAHAFSRGLIAGETIMDVADGTIHIVDAVGVLHSFPRSSVRHIRWI